MEKKLKNLYFLQKKEIMQHKPKDRTFTSIEYKPYDTIILKKGNIHAGLNEIISS